MSNYNLTLQSNNTDLQAILNIINDLPETGVELPELSNEGSASDLLSGRQLINSNGNVVVGSFTIDSELNEQDNLITQIQAVVDSLPEAGTGGMSPTLFGSYVINIEEILTSTEIICNGSVKTNFSTELSPYPEYGEVHKIIFSENDKSISFIPVRQDLLTKIYFNNYNNSNGWYSLHGSSGAIQILGNSSWASVIDFIEPTEFSQADYDILMSIMSLSMETPYQNGYE